MPIVFIPQKGEKYAFYEWRFCLSILSLPSEDLSTFYEVRHCVWVWSWVGEGMNTHHTLFVFSFVAGFQLFFPPKLNSLTLEEWPKQRNFPNIWNLRICAWNPWDSWFPDGETGRSRGGGEEEVGRRIKGKQEAWTLDHFCLPCELGQVSYLLCRFASWQCARPEEMQHCSGDY